MAKLIKTKKNPVKKTLIEVKSSAKREVEKLATDLKHHGRGDGTIHNTMLYLICKELKLNSSLNPYKNASDIKHLGKVVLNLPEEMYAALQVGWGKHNKKSTKPLTFRNYISHVINTSVRESGKKEIISAVANAESATTYRSEMKSYNLNSIKVEGREVALFTPTTFAKKTGMSRMSVQYYMRNHLVPLFYLDDSPRNVLIGVGVNELSQFMKSKKTQPSKKAGKKKGKKK